MLANLGNCESARNLSQAISALRPRREAPANRSQILSVTRTPNRGQFPPLNRATVTAA
jgi:hypothetical protein